ncbi:MAG: 50S ribosomal protein L9 [Armatimonadota bacterium]
MQVILLHDVDRVGHEGDLLKVADGYGRNYLLPQGLAVAATRGTLKDLEQRKQAIERRDGEKRAVAQRVAEELKDKIIVIKHVTGEGTKLHGTVTTQHIADAAKAQLDLNLDKRDLDLSEPIREVGDYLVSARVYKDVAAQLAVRVISDKATAEEIEARAFGEAPVAEAAAEEPTEEAAEIEEAAADEPAEG